MKSAILIVRVTQETKQQLSTFARQSGLTESGALREILEAALVLRKVPEHPIPAPTPEGGKRKQITVTVPRFIADLARDRANQKGMSLSRWIACLIQSHVYQPPVLTMTELKVLNESNRQIRAMGSNVNQIARSFNSLDIDIRKLKDFYVVEKLLKDNIEIIRDLIRAANKSWGISRGSD